MVSSHPLELLEEELTDIGGIVLTQAGMGSTQALNAAWLSSVVDDRKRPIALAMYVMGIQLAGFPGNQLFRQQGMILPSTLQGAY